MLKKILLLIFFLLNLNAYCQYCVENIFCNSFGTLGHCVAVTTKDNKMLLYGGNAYGQLGNNSKNGQKIFSDPFILSKNEWKMISFGAGHTLGIKNDGSLWSWGTNDSGRLGNGTIDAGNFLPKQIGSDKDWDLISAGTWHSLALKKDGTLWGWGNTRTESLGYFHFNLPLDQTTPIKLNNDNDWSYVHASNYTTLAIKKNGSLYGTGVVKIGTGNSGASAPLRFPEGTQVQANGFYKIGNENNWKKIITGSDDFFVMLKNDNTLWGWSYTSAATSNIDIKKVNYCTEYSQIGDSNWKDVDVSHNAFIGIKEDGTLWFWVINI